MTASNEQNLEQARVALQSNGSGGAAVTAIRGRIFEGRVWNRLVRVTGLGRMGWADHGPLAGAIRQHVDASEGGETEVSSHAEGERQAASTFLYTLHCAMRSTASRAARHWFGHNGSLHGLRTEFQAGGNEMAGQITDKNGKGLSNFRVWFDRNGAQPLAPVRFEFRPKSFLRLTFERTEA